MLHIAKVEIEFGVVSLDSVSLSILASTK